MNRYVCMAYVPIENCPPAVIAQNFEVYRAQDVDARIAALQEEADRRTREVESTYLVQKRMEARIAELEKALHEFLRVCESAVPIKFLDELGVAADMARKAMSSRL